VTEALKGFPKYNGETSGALCDTAPSNNLTRWLNKGEDLAANTLLGLNLNILPAVFDVFGKITDEHDRWSQAKKSSGLGTDMTQWTWTDFKKVLTNTFIRSDQEHTDRERLLDTRFPSNWGPESLQKFMPTYEALQNKLYPCLADDPKVRKILLKRRCSDIYGILPAEFRRYMDGVFNHLDPSEREEIMSEPRSLQTKLNTHWHIFLMTRPKKSGSTESGNHSANPQGGHNAKRPRVPPTGGGRGGRGGGNSHGGRKGGKGTNAQPPAPKLDGEAFKAIRAHLAAMPGDDKDKTSICTYCGELGKHRPLKCDAKNVKMEYGDLKRKIAAQLPNNFELPNILFV
jgi:hypothetical protein